MNKINPYLIPSPAVISFSGGRTSGMMLYRILEAYNFSLPDDIKVVFCNTGKEREETLEFVERCSKEWNVPVVWLEYYAEPSGKYRKRQDGEIEVWRHGFKSVNFSTASRNGEPFSILIQTRRMLPNPVMRFCTGDLKIKTTLRFVKSIGWTEYCNAIGFRADEPTRVAKMRHELKKQASQTILFEEESDDKDWKKPARGESPLFPLFDAKITQEDVLSFWDSMSFNLQLKPYEGNCDACFLKGTAKLIQVLKTNPEIADWWIEQEAKIPTGRTMKPEMARFRADRPPYRELKMIATGERMPGEFDFGPIDHSVDGRGCALWDDCRCTD